MPLAHLQLGLLNVGRIVQLTRAQELQEREHLNTEESRPMQVSSVARSSGVLRGSATAMVRLPP